MDYKPLLFMLIVDILWIKSDVIKFTDMIKNIQNTPVKVKYTYAMLAYMLMILGLYVYVLPQMDGTLYTALTKGGLFGIIVFGIFDMTNMAIFDKYNAKVALLDMLWGMLIYSAAGYIST